MSCSTGEVRGTASWVLGAERRLRHADTADGDGGFEEVADPAASGERVGLLRLLRGGVSGRAARRRSVTNRRAAIALDAGATHASGVNKGRTAAALRRGACRA